MIVGSGLLANAFRDRFERRDDLIVFASGVSNSSEQRASEFERERSLLAKSLSQKKKLVYFSTCSLRDPSIRQTSYVQHKAKMESIVLEKPGNFVFRLPQVAGESTNPFILTNFLAGKILANEPFDLWVHTYRNVIDVDDVVRIAGVMIEELGGTNGTLNIACSHSVSMPVLVATFERVLRRSAKYNEIDRGGRYEIDVETSNTVASRIGISFDEKYLERVLDKYYGKRQQPETIGSGSSLWE